MTWPYDSKQPKKCAVEKQTTKVTKTSSSSQTSESQNDPIKLKISQSKVYLAKQHKGSNDTTKQYNKYDAFSDSDSEMSVEESQIHKGGVALKVKIMKSNKNKNILQWHCHGFSPNFKEIKNIISNFNPNILALQEIYFKDTDNVNITGFDQYFKICVRSRWESHWWLLHLY